MDFCVITLENNMLPCNCEMEPFRKWLIHLSGDVTEIVVNHDKLCAAPEWREHDELLKAKIPWMECNSDLFTRICVVSGTALVLVIALTIALLKYFWKDIKYRQMVRKARKHNGYIPIDGIEDEIYDAFISYHPEKRIWVQDVMTAELGKGDLEFTLMYDINILPTGNESYFGGIFSHMDRSRHVIFLVTRGWMKEGMNEFEMEAAIDLLKQSKRHTLIVIMMENIPQKEMSETLKLMVRNNFCLKWSENEKEQRKFWRDLKLELGKKKYLN
ncbi:unnamed protein product [Owenia fusiformis]|uniref:Uncharacterized protein n=1 Tax=Owenia fusiformis TaxID=6347 RepID=A0A8J1XNZ6_OWEFU|nr:unnamed protein product [Owenia fusiformis]